jgi:hypothetical protein
MIVSANLSVDGGFGLPAVGGGVAVSVSWGGDMVVSQGKSRKEGEGDEKHLK